MSRARPVPTTDGGLWLFLALRWWRGLDGSLRSRPCRGFGLCGLLLLRLRFRCLILFSRISLHILSQFFNIVVNDSEHLLRARGNEDEPALTDGGVLACLEVELARLFAVVLKESVGQGEDGGTGRCSEYEGRRGQFEAVRARQVHLEGGLVFFYSHSVCAYKCEQACRQGALALIVGFKISIVGYRVGSEEL